jgi:uncharacterized protein YdhG (YjbR/CyaY superfamily)
MTATEFDTVQEYLDSFPDDTKRVLRRVQQSVRSVIPDSDEVISYGIPTFRLEGRPVVHVAGWQKHVSLYPAPDVEDTDPDLAAALTPYRSGKGTLKFPLDEPVPYELIERVVAALAERRP